MSISYARAFDVGLSSTIVCYAVFFLTGEIYVLGLACFLTFLTIFMPVLLDRGEKAKEVIK